MDYFKWKSTSVFPNRNKKWKTTAVLNEKTFRGETPLKKQAVSKKILFLLITLLLLSTFSIIFVKLKNASPFFTFSS